MLPFVPREAADDWRGHGDAEWRGDKQLPGRKERNNPIWLKTDEVSYYVNKTICKEENAPLCLKTDDISYGKKKIVKRKK